MAATSEHARASSQEFWSRFVHPRVAHIQNINPLRSKNVIEDARRMLDEEMAAMHLAICGLRTYRNALSLASCLPPEILAHIFKFVAAALPPSLANRYSHYMGGYGSGQIRLGWIRLTHVCKHWRDTALMHPSLWGHLDNNLSERWRNILVARAKSAPLSIYWRGYSPEENAVLVQHASHTRVLRLSAHHDRLQQTCESLTSPAPILEELELNGSDETIIQLTNIFAGYTPSLRRVNLKGILFPWSANIFFNLTDLCVALPKGNPLPTPDDPRPEVANMSQYDRLFNALAYMPYLRKLELAHCIPWRDQYTAGSAFAFRLYFPSLELLSLAGTYTECMGIISRLLCIPPSCHTILEFTDEPRQAHELLHFFYAHSNHLPAPTLQTFSIAHLKEDRLNSSESLSIALWRTRSSSKARRPDFHPNNEPVISIRFPPSAHSLTFVELLCNALPLEDLRVLKVAYSPDSWSPDTWVNMFGRCKRVEHVYVEGSNVAHFCKALCLSVHWIREALTSKELFFRNLRSLEVSDVDLLTNIDHDDTTKTVIELLKDQLEERENLMQEVDSEEDLSEGKADGEGNIVPSVGDADDEEFDPRLAQLRIENCSVTREAIEDMNEAVPKVLWDHFEGIHEESESEESDVNEGQESPYSYYAW